jgi:uncharacterized membrane protein
MFKFVRDKQAAGSAKSPGASDSIALDTPVRFDGRLVVGLVTEHAELNRRLGALARQLDGDPHVIEGEVRDCAAILHRLRRTEALWLYPIIARGVARDPVARRQFVQLRLHMLSLARRALRQFDNLAEAIQRGTEVDAAAELAARALGEYRMRNEAEIYPLYDFIGRSHAVDQQIA